MKKYFLNYATSYNMFSHLRDEYSKSFLQFNNFDYYYLLDEKSVSNSYKEKNYKILNCPTGAGYWLWKPYLINKLLSKINYGDIIMYCDARVSQKNSLIPVLNFIKNKHIVPFYVNSGKGEDDRAACKRDALILTNCDNESIWNREYNGQYGASYLFIVKTDKSIKIIKEWLNFCEDERIITDNPNVMGQPNYSTFKFHRHDQSILSLLCKKYELDPIYDITQYGNPYRTENWDQILTHHR